MELHRAGGGDRKLALVGLVYGVVSFAVGGLFAAVGAWLVSFIVWVPGVFFFLLGVIVLLGSARPFRIALSEAGLDVRSDGHRFTGPWSQVDGISIEQTAPAGTPPLSRSVLVLWVADGVPMRHRPSFPPGGDGRKGHVIAELDSLRETHNQVAEILRRYAGARFRPVR
ncbi:hypothetical protein [Phytohabitans houttuyneae]|uniref:PH domain-containing protein n=1 Tax=Phytohabitans houttuyneae TaxID=1076126 RepID=A0A6V8JY74_9ACTN|nr:hypothetical protein [Phytohabitans houttuyneae]GFJ77692.1 hypothetical protein Phou_018720 [Phytohabitans houttuyneae]